MIGRQTRSAPSPIGRGWGEGLRPTDGLETPSPQPSPLRGEGAHRVRGTVIRVTQQVALLSCRGDRAARRGRRRRGRLDLAIPGLHLLPRPRSLQPVDHDPIGRRETRANDAQAVDDGPELDELGADRAVVGHREHDLARLIRRDRTVRNEQRLVLAAEQAQPAEESRRQEPVLVVEYGAAANGAGLGIEHVVDEVHPPLVLELGLVGEAYRHRVLHVARGGPRPGSRKPYVAKEVGFAAVEDEMDRVDRYDEGEQRRVALSTGDEVAGIDAPVGDAPADRRPHVGPFEVERGLPQRSFGRGDLAGGVALSGLAGVEFALGYGLVAHQRGRALHVEGGDLEPGLGAFDIRIGLVDGDSVGPRIDHEQKVALLDELALAEIDRVDETGDPRPHLDALDRDEPPRVFVPLGDLFLQWPRHGHRRRRRGSGASLLAVAAGQRVGREHQKAEQSATDDQTGHGIVLRTCINYSMNPTKMLHRGGCLACYTAPCGTIMILSDEAPMYTDLALYIGGEWKNGGGRNGEDVVNPATEKPLARLPHASTGDLDAALAA